MAYAVGLKLSITDSYGKAFTSAPAYVKVYSATEMIATSEGLVRALM